MSFKHGIDLVESTAGPRPIRTVRSSVIIAFGTAPEADSKFPDNKPVLISSRQQAATIGTTGTLPGAIDGIYDNHTDAVTIVLKVPEGADAAETKSNIIGGVDGPTGTYTGILAALSAESVTGFKPKLFIAPGFSHDIDVATAMQPVLDKLRATAFIDGPNTNDADAIAYGENFGTRRFYIVDPWVTVWDTVTDSTITQPASARFAGIQSRVDNVKGFWKSISNELIYGISGTFRSIHMETDNFSTPANLLNEKKIGTIVRKEGWRTWGNLSLSSDPLWMFYCVGRTADMIHESLIKAHLWAVDMGITKRYADDVVAGVNAYLRHLARKGAIQPGAQCWADPELNSADQVALGKVYFNFDWSEVPPAQTVGFISEKTQKYLDNIFE